MTYFMLLSEAYNSAGKAIMTKEDSELTRLASMRALSGVPIPTAISLTPAESNLALDSFKAEANSQLIT